MTAQTGEQSYAMQLLSAGADNMTLAQAQDTTTRKALERLSANFFWRAVGLMRQHQAAASNLSV